MICRLCGRPTKAQTRDADNPVKRYEPYCSPECRVRHTQEGRKPTLRKFDHGKKTSGAGGV